jgi:hypothetical protein
MASLNELDDIMSDISNAPESGTAETKQVQALAVTQLRLINANERPNDAVIELTTNKGKHYFTMPKAGLNEFAEKLKRFAAKNS